MRWRTNHPGAAGAILLLLWLIIAAPARAAEPMLATAHGDHLWFIIEAKPAAKGYLLCHQAADMQPHHYKPQASLPRPPIAVASWENRVWLVFENTEAVGGGASARREVFTLQVHRDVAFGGYASEPSGRLDLLPPLPGHGSLAGFTAGAHGPLALIIPVAAHDLDEIISPPQPPILLQLRGGRWQPLALPDPFKPGRHVFIAPMPQAGALMEARDDSFCLLTSVRGDATRTLKHSYTADGRWTTGELPLDLRQVRSLMHLAGQHVAVRLGRGEGDAELIYLRSGGPAPLAAFSRPAGRWAAAGLRDEVRIIERRRNGDLFLQRADITRGEVTSPAAMEVQPLPASRIWNLAILTAALAVGVLLVVLVRPSPNSPVLLPKGCSPLAPSARMIGLAIDMLPAGFITMLILRTDLRDLVHVPFLTGNLQQGVPYLVMAGLTLAHSTVLECLTGRTLGKMMIGAQVASAAGEGATAMQLLVRNLVKGVVLVIPPLAIFALLNPNVQGLADQAAGTLVVQAPGEASDRRAESN